MAILQGCPVCRKKQTIHKKTCSCGEDLQKARRSQRVKYHIHYRLPSGKQIKQLIGKSLDDARAADGKRKGQKREGRVIPIGDELYKTLSKIVRAVHDNHVFVYQGEPTTKRFETAMKTACKDAGLTWGREVEGGLIFHDLRHAFVTDMRKAGVELTVTAAITGHAILDMGDRYDTVDLGDKQAGINKLERYSAKVTQTLPKADFKETN